jgi:hypothetical protein
LASATAHAVEEAGVDQNAVAGFGLAREGLAGIGGVRRDHAQDRQAVLGGEVEVALVVPGTAMIAPVP